MCDITKGISDHRPPQERMLKAIMGKPTVQQASLERFIMSLDEAKQGKGGVFLLFWK